MDLSKIQSLLLDAGLPSNIEDIKNPTADYIINLLTDFLSKFSINISLINQPIPEQLDVMTYYEDSDFINLINLYAVLIRVLDKIFLHNFCLNDITAPGQKRFKKQAKFLSNFVLYTILKKSEFNDKMEQIEAKCRLINELRERKAKVLESINNKVSQKGKQLSIIEKLNNDIQYMKSKIEKNNKKGLQLDKIKNDEEKKNQEVKEVYKSLKTKTEELNVAIFELQSEIVRSPEQYQSNLDALEAQKNIKEEERNVMQEAIQEKKQSIKQVEEILNLVEKMNNELSLLKDIFIELKNKKTKPEEIKKNIDSLNNILQTLQTKLAMHKDQMNNEMDELQLHQQDVTLLSDLYNQELSKQKEQKAKLDANEVCYNKKCLQRDKLHADIMKIEEDTKSFLSSCQKIYDAEIAEELKLRETLSKD